MSLQVEKLEKNMAKLTIEVSAEDLDKAMEKAYQKQKSRISLPGFRKGKAPRKMIESMYGKGVFMEDAVNSLVPQEYTKALGECDLEIVSQPEINVTQMEPGKALIFTADVAVKPEVTLGDYKGVEVPKSEIAVTDEEVDAEVKKEQDKNARTVAVEDRAAANGDITTIDFEGFVDGVAFEGGKGTDYALTLGSGTFIPGFEDQLVGANTGDHVEVKVTFPEEYQAKELAGKEAVFHCLINSISHEELPELDDEFVKDTSDFDTVDELKADVRKKLEENAENAAANSFENAVTLKLIEKVTDPIPHCMFEHRADSLMNQFANQLKAQGVSLDLYLQYTGMDQDALKETYLERAENEVKLRLALEKITELEKLEVSDEDLEAEVARLAEENNMTPDDVKKRIYVEDLRADMLATKAMDLVKESAVATDAPAEEETAAATEE